MAANFDKSLPRVLVYEGGYVNDPKDPGGATNKGITQGTYDADRRSHGLDGRPVSMITSEEVASIYRRLFWDRCRCEELPAGVDFAVFDAAVNSGPAQAGKWLQRALGDDYKGAVDGNIGPATVVAAQRVEDKVALVGGVCARRLATLQTLRTWSRFGKGWSARIANVQKTGQAWAASDDAPPAARVADMSGNAKANAADVKKPIVSVHTAAIGTAAGTAATAASQVASALDPLKDIMPKIAMGLAVLTACGGILTVVANLTKNAGLNAQDGVSEVPVVDLDADALFVQVPV
jgi:lysozyme family protein